VRVVVAEDNALLRDGLIRLLTAHDISVIDAVDNAPSLTNALGDPSVDLAIVDVRMPPTHTNEGLQAAIAARAARPGFPVLVLSQHVEVLYARELLASGDSSVGYLLKDRVVDVASFIEAVRRVATGATVLDPEVVAALLERARRSPLSERLTERERAVLALMAEGRSNAAIAARLFVSEKAVGKHTKSIFDKLDLAQAPDDNRRVLAVLAWLNDA
jgi:DNA-binding NarL/FixJ family response regulator